MKSINFRTAPKVSCRAVTCLITRNKGVPISKTVSGINSYTLCSEEALYGVGLIGGHRGQVFARLGVYGFEDGVSRFRFPVEFDMENGCPVVRQEKSGRKINDAERALVNWIQGGLFDISQKDGAYFMKVDRLANQDSVAGDQIRDSIVDSMPKRAEFGGIKSIDENVEMFRAFLEPQQGSVQFSGSPVRTPLYSPDQLRDVKEGVMPVEIAPALFKAMAAGKFCSGLDSRSDEFAKIRMEFLRSMDLADEIVNRPHHIREAYMERSFTAIMGKARSHAEQLKDRVKDLQRRVNAMSMGLQAFKAYYIHRTQNGGVKMLTMNSSRDHEITSPLFSSVGGVPVRIYTDLQASGELPYHAEELFA